jgi:hypothetical protein
MYSRPSGLSSVWELGFMSSYEILSVNDIESEAYDTDMQVYANSGPCAYSVRWMADSRSNKTPRKHNKFHNTAGMCLKLHHFWANAKTQLRLGLILGLLLNKFCNCKFSFFPAQRSSNLTNQRLVQVPQMPESLCRSLCKLSFWDHRSLMIGFISWLCCWTFGSTQPSAPKKAPVLVTDYLWWFESLFDEYF